MKRMRTWLVAIVAFILILGCGTASAVSVKLTNGPVTLTAVPYSGGAETGVDLDVFQILAVNEDGSYLLYANNELYTATKENLQAAVRLNEDVEIPEMNTVGMLTDKASGKPVSQLQIALRTLGYFTGMADGKMDKKTSTAILDFQEANGLKATGTADGLTRLLVTALAEEPVEMEGNPDPAVMFAPLMEKTDADLTPVMKSGLSYEYDATTGTGFISDGQEIVLDASGESELDTYRISLRIGLVTRETEKTAEIVPAILYRCVCVRRPVMTGMTVKAGDKRGSAAVAGKLSVELEGLYTVEKGTVELTKEMTEALAGAKEAGELKIRIEGQTKSFDVAVPGEMIEGAALVGMVAEEMNR